MLAFFLNERRTLFTSQQTDVSLHDQVKLTEHNDHETRSSDMEGQKSSNGETSQEEPAGKYKRNEIVQAKISNFYSFNEFYLNEGQLSAEQCNQLLEVIRWKHRNGSPAYRAEPYSTEIGELKIYFASSGEVFRAVVEDLYTIVVRGQLDCRATILLVDSGRRRFCVPLQDLFDIPDWVDRELSMNFSSDKARLHLSDRITPEFKDQRINSYIRSSLKLNDTNLFNVKILDYTSDETYLVDIIDLDGISLNETLQKMFDKSIKKFEMNGHEPDPVNQGICWALDVSKPIKSKAKKNELQQKVQGQRLKIDLEMTTLTVNKKSDYQGALIYFKKHLRDAFSNPSYKEAKLKKQLCRVKLLTWSDTESFYIIPDDPEYTKLYQSFLSELNLQNRDINEKNYDEFIDRQYRKGELVLFKNSVDPILGNWLRGVIIKTPMDFYEKPQGKKYNRHNNNNNKTKVLEPRMLFTIEMTNRSLYAVQSLDFGFQVVRAPRNMRPVRCRETFNKLGPWALRCRLFGVYPFQHIRHPRTGEPEHTDASKIMLDQWVRERITSLDQKRVFEVLFRTDLDFIRNNNWAMDRPLVEISLFHRFEPPYRIEHAMKSVRNFRFDCLNYELTYHHGVADYHVNGGEPSTKLELDFVVANKLALLDRL